MNRPSPSQLLDAAVWLRAYEGEQDDFAKTLNVVANWLDEQAADFAERDAVTRIVKATGVTRAQARRKLREVRHDPR